YPTRGPLELPLWSYIDSTRNIHVFEISRVSPYIPLHKSIPYNIPIHLALSTIQTWELWEHLTFKIATITDNSLRLSEFIESIYVIIHHIVRGILATSGKQYAALSVRIFHITQARKTHCLPRYIAPILNSHINPPPGRVNRYGRRSRFQTYHGCFRNTYIPA